ncbi:glycosyltransferase involved in cell wall biosynthesis [Limimaricola soesokkakensis]|uniref:Glycosyltransferase involved in cell wall biosynthesis n=1 Tax=Limimaricola soesokkakensis TaxID=1343159 RepID=A0A1X7A076_9RHOB|nr:glycosyltransferase family 4 protein [Limimaricola soesokkakensis]PSK80418.1 glycosyltransferase involved in cell wall biosynthesis [Limimaricola soesokkakensis]SLN66959.1 N, N'-diacetylbacillosaminyl-diphospho-undecaprenol alpha-1,3-N-acetylgalactosaminyltransferase [Limimaricola soesokkakensis]
MHIIFTVNAAWNIFNFRRSLVEAMLEEGHKVTVLAPPDVAVKRLEALGCHFVPLEMDVKGLSPLADIALIRELRQHFYTLAPDAVFSFTIKNNIFGAIAARGLGFPFIPNVTGLGTAFLSSTLLRRVAETLYRIAFRSLPVVFFQNPDDQALFLSRGLTQSNQSRLLPGSGVDLKHFLPAPLPERDEVRFLMIARLLRDKGILEYALAAQQTLLSHPNTRFQLLGPLDVENRSAIPDTLLEKWRQNGTIEYLGESDDVRSEIADADCVVLPSYREGAPRTLIEAAAMARPLIATDVPGCRSVVEDGRTGLLCAPRDAESLSAAFIKMLTLTSAAREEMGRAGRNKMEREFDQAMVVDAYRGVLEEALML